MNDYLPVRLPVELIAQQRPGECLAACALMVMRYLEVPADYGRLIRLLGMTEIGVPFSRLLRLSALGIQATVTSGTLPRLHENLASGLPCIVPIATRELPYWRGVTSSHAVVMCGMDRRHVHLLDPGFAIGPFLVSHDDFGLAWLERDEVYATMTA